MTRKKIFTGIILFIFAVTVTVALTGCTATTGDNGGKISVVATVFPEYDWVKNIIGNNTENANVTLLIDNGVDLHSYQASADDIIKISKCDVFIYSGGESDRWVNDALKEATNKNMRVVNLLEILGERAKEEETVEGMQTEKDGGDKEYDEHVWLSLKNTVIFAEAIRTALCEVDSENAGLYNKNTDEYIKKLNELDEQYQKAVDTAKTKTVLFADRFPFRYMTDDYGLKYYAAFAGCSAESEASFETVAFLARKVDELNLSSIITLDGSDCKIAETVAKTADKKDVRILSMDSMQSVTADDVKNGATYLSIMENNLETLQTAMQ